MFDFCSWKENEEIVLVRSSTGLSLFTTFVLLILMTFVVAADIEECPSNVQLRHLSRRIKAKWKDVARCLRPPSFQSYDIDDIEYEYLRSLSDQSAVMLERWCKEHGRQATIRHLCETLLDAECRLHAEEVFGEKVVERVAREYRPNEDG